MSETSGSKMTDETKAELFAAIQAGEQETVETLLAKEGSLSTATNEHGISALMWALYHRHQALADVIAAHRKELAASGIEHAALTLHEAAAMGQLEVVREHLNLGDDLGGFSKDGFTPLHFAAFFGREEIVPLLLESGAAVAVPAQNPSAVHPLHSAAAIGSTEICRLLLEAGAEVDAQQHGGFTALMSAALHGNMPLVELLLEHGADPLIESTSTESDEGKTAAMMAKDGGHEAVVERLGEEGS